LKTYVTWKTEVCLDWFEGVQSAIFFLIAWIYLLH